MCYVTLSMKWIVDTLKRLDKDGKGETITIYSNKQSI